MYFTSLPDHDQPGFDEQQHFGQFKRNNIIFNALSKQSYCDDHIGCLSFKTVLSGEEWYGINHYQLAIRPGQFLILNDDQSYSCHIDSKAESVRTLSVFFKKEFASAVFQDSLSTEEALLDNVSTSIGSTPEFFQTLYDINSKLRVQLSNLILTLEKEGYDAWRVDEHLIAILNHLIQAHQSESLRSEKVNAIKPSTRQELFKRLCIAKDVLHSLYKDELDLNTISKISCLSVPQLVRQFRSVFQSTPHQYLVRLRLGHGADLLKSTNTPVNEIAWSCGFQNVSAFCRAFKSAHGTTPMDFRKERV